MSIVRAFFLSLGLVTLMGCAEGSTVPSGGNGSGGASSGGGLPQGGDGEGAGAYGGAPATGGGPVSDGGGAQVGGAGEGGSGSIEQACPANEVATGFDASGAIQCGPISAGLAAAVNSGCDAYFGVRDECGSCSTAPSKWGRVSGATCANGVGLHNTCSTATIGGQSVGLFGLNPDGDVDDNDKLYAGFKCDAGVLDGAVGPCDAGEIAVSYDGTQVTCAAAGAHALEYVRQNCSLYLGARDNCGSCNTAPSKWGFAGSLACGQGAGAGNTCVSTTLGGEAVPLFGLDLDGEVDENDKLYVGLRCAPGVAAAGPQQSECPSGQVLVGTHADGTIECASPAPAIAEYVAAHCTVYAGHRDSCDGCTTIPTKYGRVRQGFCVSDAGVGNTCTNANLNGQAVSLLGLDLDGNVNDDDKLYLGFKCD